MNFSETEINPKQADFTTKIYAWMAIALLVSAISAFKFSQNFALIQQILNNPIILIVLIAVQIAFVIWLSFKIPELTLQSAKICFLIYAIASGIIISLIFQYIFSVSEISVFLILAVMYLIMSVLGYFLKQSINVLMNLILMTIIGLCLDFALNMFWRNDRISLTIAGIAILIFVGITAYTFKNNSIFEESSNEKKTEKHFLGAFAIYLNLFFLLISIFIASNKSTKKINV